MHSVREVVHRYVRFHLICSRPSPKKTNVSVLTANRTYLRLRHRLKKLRARHGKEIAQKTPRKKSHEKDRTPTRRQLARGRTGRYSDEAKVGE